MKNLKITDKLIDLVSKDEKLSKRIASLLLGGFLVATPIMGNVNAETADQVNPPAVISLVPQETVDEMRITYEEYEAQVISAYNYLSQYISYEHMLQDVQSAVYLVNYEYIDDELEQRLIDDRIIVENDIVNENGQPAPMDSKGWINVTNFRRLRDAINDYNQRKRKIDYHEGTFDINNYINPAELCIDEHDAQDATELHEKWAYSYNLEANSLRGNTTFTEAHKQATQLNAIERNSEIYDASVGARWLMRNTTGNQMLQFLRDYMRENYDYSQLDTYFNPEKLRQGQFILRDDFNMSEHPNDLEYAVDIFGQEYYAFYTIVNTDMFTMIKNDELKKDGATTSEVPKTKEKTM